ncbi:hypothetical protein HY251_03570 [bacterium]|nr:hypothetical protein [bacterium]
MSKTCEICGKLTAFGNTRARRGMAKYLGGVGVKKTGVSRRRFEVNVQKVRVEFDGHVRRAKIAEGSSAAGQEALVGEPPGTRDARAATRALGRPNDPVHAESEGSRLHVHRGGESARTLSSKGRGLGGMRGASPANGEKHADDRP